MGDDSKSRRRQAHVAEEMTFTKEDALVEIADAWGQLWTFVDGLEPGQLVAPVDHAGWAVKDHLGHLAAWERSIDFLLSGRRRNEGLGVSRQVYDSHDYDIINAAIFERTSSMTPEAIVDEFRQVHDATLVILADKSDDELLRSYTEYAPDEEGSDRNGPVAAYVMGNTAHHYHEHLEWMRELIARG